MQPISPTDAREVIQRLVARGYRPILIGGLAVEVAGFGGTKDVDVLLPEAEYGGAEFLDGSGFSIYSNTGSFTNGRLTLKNGRVIPFDVLNPARFVGERHTGEEFYRYVFRYGSSITGVGRVATPAVVYYTRLLVFGPHGRAYELRIRRDLEEGAPLRWLDTTTLIAHRFGTAGKVRPKVARLRREILGRGVP